MAGSIENIRADICIIGGGSGGLSVAAGAAQMGLMSFCLRAAVWEAIASMPVVCRRNRCWPQRKPHIMPKVSR